MIQNGFWDSDCPKAVLRSQFFIVCVLSHLLRFWEVSSPGNEEVEFCISKWITLWQRCLRNLWLCLGLLNIEIFFFYILDSGKYLHLTPAPWIVPRVSGQTHSAQESTEMRSGLTYSVNSNPDDFDYYQLLGYLHMQYK